MLTKISTVRILDAVWKTCRERWMVRTDAFACLDILMIVTSFFCELDRGK